MLQYLKDRLNEYSAGYFINDLADASKYLGILEAKISTYKFNSILIPMLHKKEALSSMYIEGTQTTISDVLENEINPKAENEKICQYITKIDFLSSLNYNMGVRYLTKLRIKMVSDSISEQNVLKIELF